MKLDDLACATCAISWRVIGVLLRAVDLGHAQRAAPRRRRARWSSGRVVVRASSCGGPARWRRPDRESTQSADACEISTAVLDGMRDGPVAGPPAGATLAEGPGVLRIASDARRRLAAILMNIAPETSVRFVTRRRRDRAAGDSRAGGAVLHAVGSRSDAVRLAPVIAALGASGRAADGRAACVGRRASTSTCFDRAGLSRAPSRSSTRRRDRRPARPRARSPAAEATLRRAAARDAGDRPATPTRTLAFALAASKLGIPIARLGGGLRCGDFSLSEEINRILSDRLADVLFTDSADAADALEAEGIAGDRVHRVGNTAIDLAAPLGGRGAPRAPRGAGSAAAPAATCSSTLHRAENVDVDDARWPGSPRRSSQLAERMPVVFPLHPRTRAPDGADWATSTRLERPACA